jgi:hypothetical protein
VVKTRKQTRQKSFNSTKNRTKTSKIKPKLSITIKIF